MNSILRTVVIALMVICFCMTFGGVAASPIESEDVAKQEVTRQAACLPASCQSYGCCSGNCGYWCRACGISYVC